MPGTNPERLHGLVDVDRGVVSREIFVSAEILAKDLTFFF